MKISNALTLDEVKNIIDRYEDHVYKDDIKYFVNEETKIVITNPHHEVVRREHRGEKVVMNDL